MAPRERSPPPRPRHEDGPVDRHQDVPPFGSRSRPRSGRIQVGVVLDDRPQVLLVGDQVGLSHQFGAVVGVDQLDGPLRVTVPLLAPLGETGEAVLVGECDRVLVFVVDVPAHVWWLGVKMVSVLGRASGTGASYPVATVSDVLDGVGLDVDGQLSEGVAQWDCLVVRCVLGHELDEVVDSEAHAL